MTRRLPTFLATLLLALGALAQAATLTLSPGQTGRLGAAGVTLLRVQDSRCPKDVACVWAGELTVSLLVSQGPKSRLVKLTFPERARTTWAGLRISGASERTRPATPLRVTLSDSPR